MCGIAGYLGSAPFDPRPWLEALAHRGPDARGAWGAEVGAGRSLHFAHTRLKIIDLTEAGAQPMIMRRKEDGRWEMGALRAGDGSWVRGEGPEVGGEMSLALTFNGEIYNFRELRAELAAKGWEFRSTGDTEVLLKGYAVWGTEVFAKCDGMFAVAIHDGVNRKLVLARDHAGIKPLYVATTTDGGFAFASEVRALVASGMVAKSVDRGAVGDFLRLGSFQEPSTVFEAIRAFPAGSFSEIALDGAGFIEAKMLEVRTYWSPAHFAPSGGDEGRDWLGEHAAMLRSTVGDQLVSDVPVGVFLSGGLDSTLLLEQLSEEHRGRVTAFTLGGEVTTNDEVGIAAQSAANLGVQHTAVRLGAGDVAEWVGAGLDAMDQPSYDGINTYLVSRASKSAGLVVVLGGTGADELHGAYGHAAQLSRFIRMVSLLGPAGKPVGHVASEVFGWKRGEVAAERLRLMVDAVPDAWKVLLEKRRFLTPSRIRSLWPACPGKGMPPPAVEIDRLVSLDTQTQVTVAELAGYLRNTLLRDCDWATMASHQELRVPYLGRRYIELMLSMPWSEKSPSGGVVKPLLGSLLSQPNRELVSHPKRGFVLNYRELLPNRFRDEFAESCAVLRETLGFTLDSGAMLEELSDPASAKRANRLWALFTLGRFIGRLRQGAPGAGA